jgi:hypothetical protein
MIRATPIIEPANENHLAVKHRREKYFGFLQLVIPTAEVTRLGRPMKLVLPWY